MKYYTETSSGKVVEVSPSSEVRKFMQNAYMWEVSKAIPGIGRVTVFCHSIRTGTSFLNQLTTSQDKSVKEASQIAKKGAKNFKKE